MAQTLTPTIKAQITGTHRNEADQQEATANLAKTIEQAFTSGTEAGKVDLLHSETVTLTTGANTTFDLTALVDEVFGSALTFVKVRAILIYSNLAANKQLTIGGDAAAFCSFLGGATETIKLDPLGLVLLTNPNTGYAVVAGTGDILKVTNAATGSSTFDIWIFGTSA